VVSGEVTPDNFLVDKVMGTVSRRTISAKTLEYRLTAADTVTAVEVDTERVNVPCLTDDEIAAVARLARRAEKHYRCPQDVEWAIDEVSGEVLLLQSRPETVWSRQAPAPPLARPLARDFDHVIGLLGAPGTVERGGGGAG
jgi:pyruvate, water dikinase